MINNRYLVYRVYLLLFLLLLFYVMESFHPIQEDEVFTYTHMALISLRSRSRVKASMVLTRDDHLFIHNYVELRSHLNNIIIPILMFRMRLEPRPNACVSDALAN